MSDLTFLNRDHCYYKKIDIILKRGNSKITIGDVGKSREEIDWKILIRREIEKTEIEWSQRRSINENNYAYRLDENEREDEAETEVMIDISGSVNLDLGNMVSLWK